MEILLGPAVWESSDVQVASLLGCLELQEFLFLLGVSLLLLECWSDVHSDLGSLEGNCLLVELVNCFACGFWTMVRVLIIRVADKSELERRSILENLLAIILENSSSQGSNLSVLRKNFLKIIFAPVKREILDVDIICEIFLDLGWVLRLELDGGALGVSFHLGEGLLSLLSISVTDESVAS